MKKIAVAAVALAAMTGSALAADIYVPPVAPPAPPPVAPAFSWAGSYAGPYAGYWFGPNVWLAGVTIGHNFVSGSLVYGVSGRLGWIATSGFDVGLDARAGVALGSTGRALLYAEAGVAFSPGPGLYIPVGAGLEFAVTNSLSLFAEAKVPLLAGGVQVTAGLNWHF
ncbi:MAG: hypothetical protein KIS96_01810 [Bauldia sp.]|nr:hypothetical protein [Bauldia sp.]